MPCDVPRERWRRSSPSRTVEHGSVSPIIMSLTVACLRHVATVPGLFTKSRLHLASEVCARGKSGAAPALLVVSFHPALTASFALTARSLDGIRQSLFLSLATVPRLKAVFDHPSREAMITRSKFGARKWNLWSLVVAFGDIAKPTCCCSGWAQQCCCGWLADRVASPGTGRKGRLAGGGGGAPCSVFLLCRRLVCQAWRPADRGQH